MRKTYPPRRGLLPSLHIQRKLVPRFFVVVKSVVAFGVKTTPVETRQTDIDPKRTVLETQRIGIANGIGGS